MDFPELNFIRPDIDPATVKPIDTRELVRFVNDFLLTSADLVNSFCGKFEERILALEGRMDSFERHLVLLERKLADIPATDIPLPEIENRQPQRIDTPKQPEKEDAHRQQLMAQPTGADAKKMDQEYVRDNTPINNVNGMPAKDHPIFGKYFRMLKMGVPEPAVKQKMQTEGFEPTILDEPNKLMPVIRKEENGSSSETEDDALSSSSAGSFAS